MIVLWKWKQFAGKRYKFPTKNRAEHVCVMFRPESIRELNFQMLKHRIPYPNPPQPTKNGIFLCCRAWHTSVCLHPFALKTSRFMIAFGLQFFWFDFLSGRGKSTGYTGVCAGILTTSWRKSVQKNGFVCCALCLTWEIACKAHFSKKFYHLVREY